jgi:hypothetical protein
MTVNEPCTVVVQCSTVQRERGAQKIQNGLCRIMITVRDKDQCTYDVITTT